MLTFRDFDAIERQSLVPETLTFQLETACATSPVGEQSNNIVIYDRIIDNSPFRLRSNSKMQANL